MPDALEVFANERTFEALLNLAVTIEEELIGESKPITEMELIRDAARLYIAYLARSSKESYREYLNSEHWRTVRQDALERGKFKCHICDSSGDLNVHHRNYEHISYERPDDLVVLCRNCHAKFHDKLP